jgi:rhodanese-related sulfurtransferase
VKDKNTNIIVYCSIGVRSEQIGEKIKKLGYKTFITLRRYFEYKNSGDKWSTTK